MLGLAVTSLIMGATLFAGTVTLLRIVARDLITCEELLTALRKDVDLLLAEREARMEAKVPAKRLREMGEAFTKPGPLPPPDWRGDVP